MYTALGCLDTTWPRTLPRAHNCPAVLTAMLHMAGTRIWTFVVCAATAGTSTLQIPARPGQARESRTLVVSNLLGLSLIVLYIFLFLLNTRCRSLLFSIYHSLCVSLAVALSFSLHVRSLLSCSVSFASCLSCSCSVSFSGWVEPNRGWNSGNAKRHWQSARRVEPPHQLDVPMQHFS